MEFGGYTLYLSDTCCSQKSGDVHGILSISASMGIIRKDSYSNRTAWKMNPWFPSTGLICIPLQEINQPRPTLKNFDVTR